MGLKVRSTIFGVSIIGGQLLGFLSPASATQLYNNYKYPWDNSKNWVLTQDASEPSFSHTGVFALDFAPIGSASNVSILAPAFGRAKIACMGSSNQAFVDIETYINGSPSGEVIRLGHLDSRTLNLVGNGYKDFQQGDILGSLLNSKVSDNCGKTDGPHLHMEFRSLKNQSIVINGDEWKDNTAYFAGNNSPTKSPSRSTNVGIDTQKLITDIQNIYVDVLNRKGDEAAIRNSVIPDILAGKTTLDNIRRQVASSDEAWNIARQTYLDVLGRTGDEVALRIEVTKALASGTSQATLRRQIAKTREVLDKVTQIYIDVLGRGDVSEDSLWKEDLELLATGQVKSLSDLRAKIAYSNFQGDSEPVRAVQKIYKDILGREGNPNDIKQYTLADLASGKTTILKIRQATANSQEAKDRINAAFQAQNGRLPFPGEMKRFTDALVSGATISDVVADIQGIKQLKGFSALSPLLPQFVQNGWKFFTDIASGLWVDPPTKKGFQYEALGTSVFKGISDFPDGIDADDTFSVFAESQFIGRYQPGQSVDFVSIFGKGVKSFSITDIESKDPSKNVVNFALPILFGEDYGSLRMRADDGQDEAVNPDKPQDVPEPVAPIATIVGFAMILKRFTKKSSS